MDIKCRYVVSFYHRMGPEKAVWVLSPVTLAGVVGNKLFRPNRTPILRMVDSMWIACEKKEHEARPASRGFRWQAGRR